jgi:hypothetical protein
MSVHYLIQIVNRSDKKGFNIVWPRRSDLGTWTVELRAKSVSIQAVVGDDGPYYADNNAVPEALTEAETMRRFAFD